MCVQDPGGGAVEATRDARSVRRVLAGAIAGDVASFLHDFGLVASRVVLVARLVPYRVRDVEVRCEAIASDRVVVEEALQMASVHDGVALDCESVVVRLVDDVQHACVWSSW